jgi:hypothetical protein
MFRAGKAVVSATLGGIRDQPAARDRAWSASRRSAASDGPPSAPILAASSAARRPHLRLVPAEGHHDDRHPGGESLLGGPEPAVGDRDGGFRQQLRVGHELRKVGVPWDIMGFES